MKRNKELILETVGENAHTEASDIVLGEGILPSLLKKFKDVESLCKAYNSLESEFTKRCQRIKELEGEIEKLLLKDNDANISEAIAETNADLPKSTSDTENAKTVDNRPIEGLFDENGQILPQKNVENKETFSVKREPEIFEAKTPETAKKADAADSVNDGINRENDTAKQVENIENDTKKQLDSSEKSSDTSAPFDEENSVSEGETLNVVLKFFNECPSAVKYAAAFSAGGFRGRVTVEKLMTKYIGILLERERELEETARKFQGEITDEVRDRIIKEYLIATKPEAINPILNCQSGLIATLPPKRPKNLAEANALAEKIIKIK